MEFPKDLKIRIKNTAEDRPRGTALLTGMPRVGKTRLAAELVAKLVGPSETFLVDFPEEEGTSTLADMSIAYYTVMGLKDLDQLYNILVQAKPKGIVWDGLGSQYGMTLKDKVPSGEMPEDHGKTWSILARQLRTDILRFKLLPSVEWFIATSLVWPDKDEITGKEGRLQVVLPGQLKSNIYGLFSYNMNIMMDAQPSGAATRVIELQPTVRTVAGVRVPWSWKLPAKMSYDLSTTGSLDKIIDTLRINNQPKEG